MKPLEEGLRSAVSKDPQGGAESFIQETFRLRPCGIPPEALRISEIDSKEITEVLERFIEIYNQILNADEHRPSASTFRTAQLRNRDICTAALGQLGAPKESVIPSLRSNIFEMGEALSELRRQYFFLDFGPILTSQKWNSVCSAFDELISIWPTRFGACVASNALTLINGLKEISDMLNTFSKKQAQLKSQLTENGQLKFMYSKPENTVRVKPEIQELLNLIQRAEELMNGLIQLNLEEILNCPGMDLLLRDRMEKALQLNLLPFPPEEIASALSA